MYVYLVTGEILNFDFVISRMRKTKDIDITDHSIFTYNIMQERIRDTLWYISLFWADYIPFNDTELLLIS